LNSIVMDNNINCDEYERKSNDNLGDKDKKITENHLVDDITLF